MNTELCKKLQIDDEVIYKQLENNYKEAFEKYILSVIDIGKYDLEIANSNLDFGKSSNKQILYSKLNIIIL